MNRRKLIPFRGACLVLAAVLAVFTACQADEFTAPEPTAEDAVVFELNVPAAATQALTRIPDVTRENRIETLDVLAFTAEGRFYRHYPAGDLYTIDGGGKWLYRLPLTRTEAQGLRFTFFANLHDEVSQAVAEGRITEKNDLYRQIEFTNSDWTSHSDPFPFWGETPDAYDSSSAHVGLNRVALIRPVSTVDVVLNGNSFEAMGLSNFQLACVRVYDVPDRGCAAPAPDHFEFTERQTDTQVSNAYRLKEATVVADAGRMTLQAGETAATNALRGQIIVPESDADGAWNTTFLIGGYYAKSKQLSWYRVNLSERDATTGLLRPADLLRNQYYILNITRVTQEGFATPEEAYEHPAENIQATLELRPDVGGLNHIAYDAATYLAADKAELRVAAQQTDQLQVLTNAAEGWKLTDVPDWLDVSADGGTQGQLSAITFSLKDGYIGTDEEPATIRLRTDRLELAVEVYPGHEGVVEYETPYVQEVWQASDFGLADGNFVPGGMAFLQDRYVLLANNSHADGPAILVYDRDLKQVAASLKEWTWGGETLDFKGTEEKPDYIDDVAIDEVHQRLYVARRQSCVDVFDLTDPLHPTYVTRIGKWGEAAAYTRNRLSGGGAVLPAANYLLVRDDMSVDTYLYQDITPGKFQEITCVTRDNQKMTHSGHQPAQWAVDPVDGGIYLTDYNASFQGIYRLDPSRADNYVQTGLYWRQHDLRERALPLSYAPTGLLITERKVYVTRQDGSLDVFSRKTLSDAPAATALRRSLPGQAEQSVGLRTTSGRPGKLQKIYQDPRDPDSFWSMDLTHNTLVRLNFYRSSIEVLP